MRFIKRRVRRQLTYAITTVLILLLSAFLLYALLPISLVPEKRFSPENHKLCVVVPFRDRFNELIRMVPALSSFLENQQIYDSEFLVINQVDAYRFNRASLINVGYFASLNVSCDYFAMHDVDLVPLDPKLDYGFPHKTGVYHVSSPAYHPIYHYKTFIGGILLVSTSLFERLGGMSNRFWGWGREDDEFYARLKAGAGLVENFIDRPFNLSTNQSNAFLSLHNKARYRRDSKKTAGQKAAAKVLDRRTGLSNVVYTVERQTNLRINGVGVTVIDVNLDCDVKDTPWCLA